MRPAWTLILAFAAWSARTIVGLAMVLAMSKYPRKEIDRALSASADNPNAEESAADNGFLRDGMPNGNERLDAVVKAAMLGLLVVTALVIGLAVIMASLHLW